MGVLIFLGIVVIVLNIVMVLSENAAKDEQKSWLEKKYKEYGLYRNIFKIVGNNTVLVYSNKGIIYLLNLSIKNVKQSNIKNVLDVEINIISKEKNIKKIMSVRDTFNKNVTVLKIEFKITTRKSVYVVDYVPKASNINSDEVSNKLKQLNRYKLIIEKDLKEFNIKEDSEKEFVKLTKTSDTDNNIEEDTLISKTSQDPLERIKTLKELLDMGALTQDEFDTKKKELLKVD